MSQSLLMKPVVDVTPMPSDAPGSTERASTGTALMHTRYDISTHEAQKPLAATAGLAPPIFISNELSLISSIRPLAHLDS